MVRSTGEVPDLHLLLKQEGFRSRGFFVSLVDPKALAESGNGQVGGFGSQPPNSERLWAQNDGPPLARTAKVVMDRAARATSVLGT